jgi:hypothetical protein
VLAVEAGPMPWRESLRRCGWLISAWGWASLAHAAQPLDLSWQAPAGCPQESAVREQIRALVPSAMLESAQLKAEGTITRVDQRFRLNLRLRLGDIRGERSIESDSCSDLAGAAAVALGLLLQSATQPDGAPGAATESNGTSDKALSESSSSNGAKGEPAPAVAGQTTSTASPPPQRTTPVKEGSARPRNWHVVLRAPELGLDVGPLPKPSIGLAVAAGIGVQHWLFAGSFQLPRSQRLVLPGASGAAADLEHLSAELWACRSWRAARLELGPCFILGMERLAATGAGEGVSPQSQQTTWLSLGAAALGRLYVVDWLAITASVGGKLQGARPIIRIDGLEDYRRLAPAALSCRTGLMWIF